MLRYSAQKSMIFVWFSELSTAPMIFVIIWYAHADRYFKEGMFMKDFLLFRQMLFPAIVQVIFGVASIVCVLMGLYGVFHHDVFTGIAAIVLGPLCIRILCEYLIVLFRINNTLTEIKNSFVAK